MTRPFARLETEQRNVRSSRLDILPTARILQVISEADAEAVASVRSQARVIEHVVDRVVETIRSGGRLFLIGAGTSGRLAVMEAAECPPTFDTPPWLIRGIMCGGAHALLRSKEGAEDRFADGAKDMARVRAGDLVIGIAASGSTPYVVGALRHARRVRAGTVLISCNPAPRAAEIVIALPTGPEVIAGSTRMKAGTATKLALNAITTAAMVRLGKVYDNLMVDLQVRSEKLRARAIRIIRTLTGCDARTAERTLRQARGRSKVAIVMLRRNVDYTAAVRLIDRAQGSLRRVIG